MSSGIQHLQTPSSPTTPATTTATSTAFSIGNPTTPIELDLNNMRLLNPNSLVVASAGGLDASLVGDASTSQSLDQHLSQPPSNPPSNLLVIFLQACSAILQETKIENNNIYDTIKLFMLVLVCIGEDQYANSILHDSNVLYSVFLYKAVWFYNKTYFD